MNNTEKVIDSVLLSVGGAYSLANIEHILGIIILVIQIGWIAIKLIIKIKNSIQNKASLDVLDSDVNNLIGSIGDIADSLNSEDNEENVNNDTEQK